MCPDLVLKELQERADHFQQHVEDVARAILVHAIASDQWRGDLSSDELLERARKIRERHPDAWMTEEFLRHAKSDGRA